jgi:hypothetical protein
LPAGLPTGDRLIQDSYERRWGRIVVDGDEVRIPYRHYQEPSAEVSEPRAEIVRQAWLTRSSRGRLRQLALRTLFEAPASWHVPFVLQLCGEYVIEIGRDVAVYASSALPRDLPMIAAYRQFWRENPDFVALTYARVGSYWGAYYRGTLMLAEYPPYVALGRIETLIGM